MSKTGTYKFDKEIGRVVKISDNIPKNTALPDVYFKKPYWDDNLESYPIYIRSKRHKQEELAKRGLFEKGGKESKRHFRYMDGRA